MKKYIYAFVLVVFSSHVSFAQYCSPSFLNGCFNWNSHNIELDSIVWELGTTDCAISDYTSLSTTITQGQSMAMMVTNGAWCGVGVWADFNLDNAFDDSENLYHSYQAGDPMTYDFTITVPASVAAGSYRLRVISGWGTDCFDATSANGYGACGTYQYGTFQDFTLHVAAASNVANTSENLALQAFPNPTSSSFQLIIPNHLLNSNYVITNVVGEVVQTGKLSALNTLLNTDNLSKGVYLLSVVNKSRNTIRIVKN